MEEERKEEKDINLSVGVLKGLEELQSSNGMYELYDVCLNQLEEMLFVGPENISLTTEDTLSYLRILRMLRQDLKRLSGAEVMSPNDIRNI